MTVIHIECPRCKHKITVEVRTIDTLRAEVAQLQQDLRMVRNSSASFEGLFGKFK